jgi:PDZ domain
MKAASRKAFIGFLCLFCGGFALSRAQTNPPASAPAPADEPKFAYGGDAAEIAAQFVENLVFLSARINGSAPSLFQLNTVAATSSIAPDRAAEIERVNVPNPVLNLTGLDFPFASLAVEPKPEFGPRVGMGYQGTLGRDFLSPLVVQIDSLRETVRAYAPASYKYSGKGLVFPLSQTNGIPVISLRFALERGKEVNANFIVDTALDASVAFNDKYLAAHKMNDDRGKTIPAIDPLSGAPTAALGRMRTLMFAKDIAGDVLTVFSDQAFPDAGTPVAGAIGSGMLRRFIVTFDFPHHQLILEPNSHFPEPDQEDKSGLLVVAKGTNYKTFEVVNVQPNSPAALAGIKKGDIIAGIDTDPAADLSLLTVRNLFCQVGHKYKITIQRGDQTQEITLQMHRYF